MTDSLYLEEPKRVIITEHSDRYLVENADTGENEGYDETGWCYRQSAVDWAIQQGFTVLEDI